MMQDAIQIIELPPITGYEDQIHFRYECPHCHQERKMVHAFIKGKQIKKDVNCARCKKWFRLFVPEGFIKSTVAWIRRMQISNR